MTTVSSSILILTFAAIFVCFIGTAEFGLISVNDNVPRIDNCATDDDRIECKESEMHPTLTKIWDEVTSIQEKTNEYWIQRGIEHVEHVSRNRKEKIGTRGGNAKNVILFIGDGMSMTTLAATRLYLGGVEKSLSFENFPYTGMASTSALDRMVPDMAASATALLCGVKTKFGLIGLDGTAKTGSCETAHGYMDTEQSKVSSIAEWALNTNKWTGFVTTGMVTDATPAALYAHINDPMWTSDIPLKMACFFEIAHHLKDIGLELITGSIGERLKVMMGSGFSLLLDKKISPIFVRSDGRNLVEDFLSNPENVVISSKEKFKNVNLTKNGHLLGIFHPNFMPYHLESKSQRFPSLMEMTEKAIEILRENNDGFFLLVDAANIGRAHHQNYARLAIDETAELNKAVIKALQMTNSNETLIVVTSNHGQAMSLSGYACRNCDVFGYGDESLKYKVLSYANGPGYNALHDVPPKASTNEIETQKGEQVKEQKEGEGKEYEDEDEEDGVKVEDAEEKEVKQEEEEEEEKLKKIQKYSKYEEFPAIVNTFVATHGGEDVAVFANGPGAYLFDGIYDQSTIPHLIAFAAGLHKDNNDNNNNKSTNKQNEKPKP